jgi:hypothetical protein
MDRRVGNFEVLFIERHQYGEEFFHRKLKFFTVREIRHQRINICLQRVLVRLEITGPGQRHLFTKGLQT